MGLMVITDAAPKKATTPTVKCMVQMATTEEATSRPIMMATMKAECLWLSSRNQIQGGILAAKNCGEQVVEPEARHLKTTNNSCASDSEKTTLSVVDASTDLANASARTINYFISQVFRHVYSTHHKD